MSERLGSQSINASTLSLSESSSDSSETDDENQGKTIHELCINGTLHEVLFGYLTIVLMFNIMVRAFR